MAKNKEINGVIWSAIDRFATQGVQFLLSIIIARLVLPSDYGLIAMFTIFLAIAQTFVDSGFGSALVQKKDTNEVDFSTAFYFNFVIAIVLYIILYLTAPQISAFYEQPELTAITRIAGMTLIINSLCAVHRAKLTISLDFKRMAFSNLISVFISGILGIWLAYTGKGVWALVFQSLSNNFLNMVILWLISKWKPGFVFSVQSFKTLFSFGSKLLLSSLLHTLYVNLYSLVIGKFFNARELGYFNRASVLASFPSSNLSTVIVRAVYPVQCKMQDDNEALTTHFKQYLRVSCYMIFPLMIGFCVLAQPLVLLVLKEKWLPAVPYLQILSIAYMWDSIMKLNGSILNAKGRSDLFFKAEIIKKITAFIIMAATIPFGIIVMCLGLVAYAFADMIIISHYTKQMIGINFITQMKSISVILLISVVMGIVVFFSVLYVASPMLKLAIGTTLGIMVYAGLSKLMKLQEYKGIVGMVKSKLGK